jgi:hypothetical protein
VSKFIKELADFLKQKWFYLKTHTKSLKIREINQENPENHFNLGINLKTAYIKAGKY